MMILLVSLFISVLTATAEPSLFPKPSALISGPAVTCGNFLANHIVNAPTQADIDGAKNYLRNIAKYIFYDSVPPAGSVNSIDTIIARTATVPMEAEQGYSISFSGEKITVSADTIFGAYHAYETILQLIKYDEELSSYVIYKYSIQDSPRFKWRGLLMDTARHFHPISSIKRQIMALAVAKMNVLHWHISDAESFSWKPDNSPEMAKGAYGEGRLFYTSQDVKNIVEFGKKWGVYVYVEIDTPGHTYSWRKAYPDLVANCPIKSANINNVALDISKDQTYEVVSKLYNEIVSLTGGKYVHLGGDEVITSCWREDPDMAAMIANHGGDAYDAWTEYTTKIDGLLDPNAVPIFWQEVYEYGIIKNVRTSAIIQSWADQKTLGKIVKAGYRGLLSGGWYLDKQIPRIDGVTHYGFYDTWRDFYENEPTAGLGLTAQEEKLILGGEACLWGEGIDVGAIDTFVWPRALAVSERLWSSKYIVNEDDAKARIQVHRCNLLRRGIAAGPIGPNEPCEGQFIYWNFEQYNDN